MKALLRFQAVVLVRSASDRRLRWLLVMPLLMALMMFAGEDRQRAGFAAVAVLGLAPIAMMGMGATYDALDSLRWTATIRGSRVLAAHFLFWTAASALPAAALAVTLRKDAADTILVFANAMLIALAAAAVVPVHQRWRRNGTFESAMGLIALTLVLMGLGGASAIVAGLGRPVVALAASCAALGIAATVVVRSVLHEERLPAASGATDPREIAPVRRTARTPVASLLRATYSPNWTGLWVVFGGVLPLFFPSMNIFAIWTPLAASNVAGFGLQTWRWLAATPIDRDRAFRILFGPALAFVLVVSAARIAIVETTTDRSVFFRDDRREGFHYAGPSTLTLSNLLETGPTGNGYRPAEVHQVAAGVSDHLRGQFGAVVPLERIEADLRLGWPEHPTPGAMDDDMGYVLDGLERIRLDLADEIAGASRRHDVVIAAGLVLAFLVMLRAQFRGRVLGIVLVIVVGLPFVTLDVFRRDFPAFAAATDRTFAALMSAPPAVVWLLLAAACALGVFLWRSARAAFRRIDVLDLPPNPLVSSKR